FLEADLEVVAEIGAALRSAAPAPAEEIAEAEHVAENVGEVAELGEDGRIEPGAAAGGRAHARMAEAIVGRTFVRVREHRVRLGGFLESLFGRVIAGIAIGMVFERQLP